jgi:hypothetical protein
LSDTGLGSRERGNDDVMDVIDGRRGLGLGSRDFSRAVANVAEYDFSSFSNVDDKLLERDLLRDLSLVLLVPLLI